MRVHALMALLALMAGVVLGLTTFELAVLVLTIVFVMAMEMMNTAIEAAVDLVTDTYHPLARIAKNVAAGAVLLAAIASIFVGVLLFLTKLGSLTDEALTRVELIPEVVTLGALAAVLIVVLLVKASGSTFRLQGGFPSAHTALAFSMATIIWLLGSGGVATVFAVSIAALVGQARVEAKIHTVFEVVSGAVIGILMTLTVFQVLR